MARITQNTDFENGLISTINAFFHTFGVASLLKCVGAYKVKGVPTMKLFRELFSLVFLHRTLFRFISSTSQETGKDTFYRFINSCRINWMKFTTLLAAKVVRDMIEPLTDKTRVNVFIVDDTPYERNRSKKVELLSRVYDHCKKTYFRGFRLLTLGFSDGNSFIPVNSCLLASEDKAKRFHEVNAADKRTSGCKQRRLAQSGAPTAMKEMIRQALDTGLRAPYVLFDSWFSFPCHILALKAEMLDVIARVKKTSKVHYRYKGEMLSAPAIFKMNKKRRGRSKYLLSIPIEVCDAKKNRAIPAKLVYVRNKKKPKDYVILLSTDVSLPGEEVIRIYGKRWDIEVFFKACKSYLHLGKECASRSFDAMTAYTAVVFARYTMLSLESRIQCDGRAFGAMFYAVCDELPDIKFAEAFILLMKAFFNAVEEKLFLSSEELEELLECFFSKLPQTIKDKLFKRVPNAQKSFMSLAGC
jgi:hypothetical protein